MLFRSIEAEELETALFALEHILNTLKAVNDDVLALLFELVIPDFPAKLLLKMSLHIVE